MRRGGHGRLIVLRQDAITRQRLAPMCRKRTVRVPSGISFRFAITITPAMVRVSRWTAARPSRLQIVVRLVDIKGGSS